MYRLMAGVDRLGIQNSLVALVRTWNECLNECGKQLTAILIDHHSSCHQAMLTDIQVTIRTEFNDIMTTYNHQVPVLESKLKYTESEISSLIKSMEDQLSNSRKRSLNTDNEPKNKRSKEDNQPEENTITSQVKSAITQVLGNMNLPNRSRG